MQTLDVQFVRQHFPAFRADSNLKGHFFDSAASSLPCQETITALNEYYVDLKVQPGNAYPVSHFANERIQIAKHRWAKALGIASRELGFGPSTSQNTYVLAQALCERLTPQDEVIVTNQDHEANIGAIRRACMTAGAKVVEWRVDPLTGLLDIADYASLLTHNTKVVCFPHVSNITGATNDAKTIISLAKSYAAYTIVDAVSYVPHSIPDINLLGADVYLFSLRKVYSVQLGVMVVREAMLRWLPNQGHHFTKGLNVDDLLVPAGPDHAQIAAANGVLKYIETLAAHHHGPDNDLQQACQFTAALWQQHEHNLFKPLLHCLERLESIKVIGTTDLSEPRCPLVTIAPLKESVANLARRLWAKGILVSHGHFYAPRLLEAMGIAANSGGVRISLAHYNHHDDVATLMNELQRFL